MKLLTELAALHKLFYIIARIWANCRDADTCPEYRFIQIADFIVISLDFKGRNRPGHHTRTIYKKRANIVPVQVSFRQRRCNLSLRL